MVALHNRATFTSVEGKRENFGLPCYCRDQVTTDEEKEFYQSVPCRGL
jgi:hypothetical protein